MLTKELAIAAYDLRRATIVPDRLTRRTHAHYVHYAREMLRVYRESVGQTRREIHRQVQSLFASELDCPARRIGAFCKLLDDVAQYEKDRRGRAATLRREVFRRAASRHPLVRDADQLFESDEMQVKSRIADELGKPWEEIEDSLFADVIDFHRLRSFEGYPDPESLLSRYNVAQVQAALYRAVTMTVWAQQDLKTILRYAKLAHLLHTVIRQADGVHRIRFNGPSAVLRNTRRYGAAMACFLPALIACRDWRMHAVIQGGSKTTEWSLDLSSQDGLRSHLPAPEEFDSQVEASFATEWGDQPRDGWRLERESEILHRGQKTFLPDFVFQRDDGTRVFLEVVGFWTPEYLQAKAESLLLFADQPLLLAVAKSTLADLPCLPCPIIPYGSSLKVEAVLAQLHASWQ